MNSVPLPPPKSLRKVEKTIIPGIAPEHPKITPSAPPPTFSGEKTPQKKWTVDVEEKTLNLKDFEGKKSADLTKEISWSKMKGMAFSSTGSSGVFFCLLEDDTVVVVKGNSTVGEELFTSEFAPLLGVKAPKMRLVEYSSKNFPKAPLGANDWRIIKKTLPKHAGVHENKVNKELYRAFFVLMEFIAGSVDLQDVDKELLETKEILQDIGRILVMDLVLNNWDRMPAGCMWKHEGNPNNMLFQKSTKRCVAIDQSVTPVFEDVHKEGNELYLNEVRTFVQLIKKNEQGDPIESVCKMIENYSSIKISKEGRETIHASIVETIKTLILLTKDDINNLKEKVKRMLSGSDWDDVYLLMMKKVDVNFICSVIDVIRDEFEK
jgi:hypothetical protein